MNRGFIPILVALVILTIGGAALYSYDRTLEKKAEEIQTFAGSLVATKYGGTGTDTSAWSSLIRMVDGTTTQATLTDADVPDTITVTGINELSMETSTIGYLNVTSTIEALNASTTLGTTTITGGLTLDGNVIGDDFVGLSDTPANFTSKWGYGTMVNADADALEFVDIIETATSATTSSFFIINSEAEATTASDGTYVKLKDIKMTHGGSVVVDVYASTTTTTSPTGGALAIYVDGVVNNVLTADNVSVDGADFEGEATGLVPGSSLQIYAKLNGSGVGIGVKNLRIYGAGTIKTNVRISTSTAQLIQE